jgi:4-hydroxybenzoate polyprenyltransferase
MLKALLKTMRPKQWAKNVFLMAALVFDRKLTNADAILHTIIGVIVFSLVASVVYIINDIADVEADRQHPIKRERPIAAGKLPISVAWVSAIVLALIAFPVAIWLSPGFALITLLYLINVVRFSPWIYIFTTFLALLMGTGKRRAELSEIADGPNAQRRVLDGYTLGFLDQLITLASGITIITYSLYTFSAPNLPENHIMMLTIPFIIYSIFRYQYLLQVKGIGSAPEELVLSDRPLQIAIALWGLAVLVVFYIS